MECIKCKTPLPNHARFCMTCGNDVSGDPHGETLAEPHDPELLTKLQEDLGADYVIERELGRGGMAIVYLGEDVHIGRKVAIKLLPPALTFGHGAALIDRFKREARTAGTLDHPNIIPIFRVSSGGKLFWYVMKYIEGESLEAVLEREGQMSLERVCALLTPVADALDYANRKNVIHRDVKPANILVDPDGRVTVTDFGIAKALGSNSLTGSGSILGTPHYMSPEQCAGKKLTGASDQYSLAIAAYQMFAGAVPFTGDSAVEIIKQHTLDDPPPLRDVRPDIHERVVAALERGLAKRPEDRFATVTDFVRGLQGLAAVAKTAAAPAKPAVLRKPQLQVARTPPGPAVASASTAADASATGTAPRPGRRWFVLALQALVAVGLGFGAVVMWLANKAQVPAKPEVAGPPVVALAPNRAPVESTQSQSVAAREDTPATKEAAPVRPPVADQRTARRPDAKQPAPAARPARLALRVSPVGAAITRDGELVRGDTVLLAPGRHTIVVNKAGFRDWSETITVRDGEQLARIVSLDAILEARLNPQAQATPKVGPPAPTTQKPEAPPPTSPKVETQAPSVAPTGPTTTRPGATGRIFLGTNIPARISVNGKPASNPVNNLEVPAGTVAVRFAVTDSIGTWEADSAITVAPDGVFRRRFQLTRPGAAAVSKAQPAAIGPATTGAPAPTGASGGTARVFVGTSVPATIWINGTKTSNPVNNLEVPAGPVRVHFEVRDSLGTWEADSTITAQPGAVLRKRFQLRRP